MNRRQWREAAAILVVIWAGILAGTLIAIILGGCATTYPVNMDYDALRLPDRPPYLYHCPDGRVFVAYVTTLCGEHRD